MPVMFLVGIHMSINVPETTFAPLQLGSVTFLWNKASVNRSYILCKQNSSTSSGVVVPAATKSGYSWLLLTCWSDRFSQLRHLPLQWPWRYWSWQQKDNIVKNSMKHKDPYHAEHHWTQPAGVTPVSSSNTTPHTPFKLSVTLNLTWSLL